MENINEMKRALEGEANAIIEAHRRLKKLAAFVTISATSERSAQLQLVAEQLTVRQIVKRLNHSGWRPRSGKPHWATSTLHHLLADPVYTDTAYFNRYHYHPPHKPRQPQSPRATEASCRTPRPREEWIGVSVPVLIDDETYQRAQTQLARNSQLSFRHNKRHSYLLRCLLRCGLCGLNMSGRTYPAAATRPLPAAPRVAVARSR